MSIRYNEETKIFQISTRNTTYMMGVFAGKYLLHLYYGRKMEDMDCRYLFRKDESPQSLHGLKRSTVTFLNTFPFEYPAYGTGDCRHSCLRVRTEGGHRVCELHYEGHRIYEGKPVLKGMPATFQRTGEMTEDFRNLRADHGTACDDPVQTSVQTLEIILRDQVLGLKILLRYSIFADSDAIIRSVMAVNESSSRLYLENIQSVCLDMDNAEYELTTLHGVETRERHMVSRKVTEGSHRVASLYGETSHKQHPFMMLTGKGATQKQGDVYGMHLIYSGNFAAETELNHQDSIRMTMGINPDGFQWVLEPEMEFQTPEAVLVYSAEGIGKMTRCFHDLYRNHLIRSRYLHEKRPILINNWEGTYFDFDDDKLVQIAREAKKAGIEMLVMDDGWFGKRNNDESSLGDWFANGDKLKEGIEGLVKRVNGEGMKFGIWFEPEMVSPDSDLFRAHPDWAIQVPGREITMQRHQYVLDMTRQDVRDYIYGCLSGILHSANIQYVKWDMNRPLSDIGSFALDSEHMGEFCHRYVLGVYEMQERLIREFPDLLLENCSGGGGRFDPGMLYYSPQIWTSDNMDPIDRLAIQEGTALIYPLSTMGAHVCVCPNHTTGRSTPLETRAYVAMAGTFGYELDMTALSEEEKARISILNEDYHRYSGIYREGDYYRIASARENHTYDCWQVVTKDRAECLVTFVQVRYISRSKSVRLMLEGLEPKARYQLLGTEEIYSGEMLMNAGYLQDMLWGEYESRLLHFRKVICNKTKK